MLTFLMNLWGWLDGKKTVIGATITLFGAVAVFLGIALPAFGVDAVHVALYVGFVTQAVGLLHKLGKALGAE